MWLYRYRFGGKRKNMSFGVFPAVTLKMAREKCHDAENLLDQQQDPAIVREVTRQQNERARHTIRAVRQEWLTTKLAKQNKAKATIKRETWNLGQLYHQIGDKGLCEIEPARPARVAVERTPCAQWSPPVEYKSDGTRTLLPDSWLAVSRLIGHVAQLQAYNRNSDYESPG